MANNLTELLSRNDEWASEVADNNPELLAQMAAGQSPKFLWIGCADSRVPASVVTKQDPGNIFVQRNVANMVVHTDYNLLAVINYAVKALKVEHIIVCGHYGCGGVKAAMGSASNGALLDNYVNHVKEVYAKHEDTLNAVSVEDDRWNKFVELNAIEQSRNVAKLSFIQEEWNAGGGPQIHAVVFDLASGKLKDLGVSVHGSAHLEDVFKYS